MKKRRVPPKIIRRGHDIYIFEKEHKKDQIYWVDHYVSYTPGFNNDDFIMGELLVSFDCHRIFNLWCDYPWKFTPEQKALFDKENPYWADFFERRNGTEPPIVDENGVGTIHFND